jgi:hypothetical protein
VADGPAAKGPVGDTDRLPTAGWLFSTVAAEPRLKMSCRCLLLRSGSHLAATDQGDAGPPSLRERGHDALRYGAQLVFQPPMPAGLAAPVAASR